MGGNGFNSAALIKNAGPAAEGVLVGTAWNSASAPTRPTRPSSQLMKARGIDPDQFCAQAYTGVLVIAEAIAQAGMKGGRDDIKAGFAKVKDLPTPLGKFSFLPSRDGNHEPAVQQVKDGKFQIAAVAAGAAPRGPADHQRPLPGQHLRAVRAGLHAGLRRARHPQPGPRRGLHVCRASWRWSWSASLHLPILAALPAGRAGRRACSGVLLERVAFRPLRGRTDSNISGLISSLAMATILEAIVARRSGARTWSASPSAPCPTRSLKIGGGGGLRAPDRHHRHRAGHAVLGLTWLVRRTRLGRRDPRRGREPAGGAGAGRRRRPHHRRLLLHLLGAGRRRPACSSAWPSTTIAPDMGRSVELKGLAVIIARRHGQHARRGAGRRGARAARGLHGGLDRRRPTATRWPSGSSSWSWCCGRAACSGRRRSARPEAPCRSNRLQDLWLTYQSTVAFIGLNGLLALSVYTTLSCGQLSLAQAGFMAIGAYAVGHPHLPRPASPSRSTLAVATLLPALVAVPLGLPVLRLKGVFLAIATIGFGEVVRLFFVNLDFIERRAGPDRHAAADLDLDDLRGAGRGPLRALAHPRLAVPGFALEAIREDEPAARTMGIDAARYKLAMLALGASFAGLAGRARGPLHLHGRAQRPTPSPAWSTCWSTRWWAAPRSSTGRWWAPPSSPLLPEVLREISARGRARTRPAAPLRERRSCCSLVILFLPEGISSLPRRVRAWLRSRREAPCCLACEGVRRTFGGLRAVDGASLEVGAGEVHGLIGPNGAGKTTLLNLISGLIAPTSGAIVLDGGAHRRPAAATSSPPGA